MRRADLTVLAESAAGPGFARAAIRFLGELGGSMVEPARFARARAPWAGDGPRRAYAEEVAALLRCYRDGLGLPASWTTSCSRGRRSTRCAASPPGAPRLFVYGFDDFRLELDALRRSPAAAAPTCWCRSPSSPEDGVQGRGRDTRGAAGARRARALWSRSTTTTRRLARGPPPSRARLVRGRARPAGPRRRDLVPLRRRRAGRAGVGGRACARAASRRGSPGNVAVVFREPGRYASLIEQVFDAYGIPYSIDRKVQLGHTGVGRGLLALMRCALPAGAPRTCSPTCARPGCSGFPAWRTGSRPSCGARARSFGRRARSGSATAGRSTTWIGCVPPRRPAGYVAELERRALRLFSAPHERVAAILRGPGLDEASAARGARGAARVARAGGAGAPPRAPGRRGARLDPARVLRVLEELEVRLGEDPQPDRVQVASPEAIRAPLRGGADLRAPAGELPRGSWPSPSCRTRIARIAAASGLVLPVREDRLERERYLF